MLRSLARKLTCRHRALDCYTPPGGGYIDRCLRCGTRWVTYPSGTRVRLWVGG